MALVLVVDDHLSNRELLITLLKHAGHDWVEAENGAAALEIARSHRPDLVICDILMPIMDGYEFVRKLRHDPAVAHTRIMFYSATFMEEETRRLAEACGVRHVLVKPCEPEEILLRIDQALREEARPVPAPDINEFDREHLRVLTDKLACKVAELESAHQRLSALTELNVGLAAEPDVNVLLDRVCRGTRELMSARAAVLAVQEGPGEAPRFWASGVDLGDLTDLRALYSASAPAQCLVDGEALRLSNRAGDAGEFGLPAELGPIHDVIAAPLCSLRHRYGWVMLIDPIGGEAFTEQDRRLLAVHAAQAGRIFESGALYREVQRTAAQLQTEVMERKAVAEALREANESLEARVLQRTTELRDMVDGLESFNRTVSHDLRGPLGGIAGAATLVRGFISDAQYRKADHLLGVIAEQATRTGEMVDALMQLARASDGPLHLQSIDLSALAREALTMLQFDPSHPLPVTIEHLPRAMADPVLVRQVFFNLIGNALKFSGQSAKPEIKVATVLDLPGTCMVWDNGVGFDSQQAKRLFKPFSRLHGTRFAGSGIGLSLVKRIMDRHGGAVWAEGRPGEGSVFFLTFPPG